MKSVETDNKDTAELVAKTQASMGEATGSVVGFSEGRARVLGTNRAGEFILSYKDEFGGLTITAVSADDVSEPVDAPNKALSVEERISRLEKLAGIVDGES